MIVDISLRWLNWIIGIGTIIAVIYFLFQMLPVIAFAIMIPQMVKLISEVLKE